MNYFVKYLSLITALTLVNGIWPIFPKSSLFSVRAETKVDRGSEAQELLQKADDLVNNKQFTPALLKYQRALTIYREIKDNQGETNTRQKLDAAITGAAVLADQRELEIKQKIAASLKNFPKTEDNNKATELRKLVAQELGFYLIGKIDENNLTIDETRKQSLENIKEELGQYVNEQLEKSDNNFDPIPENLSAYLAENAAALAAIRNLILSSPDPVIWGDDIPQMYEENIKYILPSYLGSVNLHRLLVLDAMQKKQQGKTTEMLGDLEASWRINQSLQNTPTLIGQLVGIINTRITAGLMRKLNNLPPDWSNKILAHDYRQSMNKALNIEAFITFAFLNQIDTANINDFFDNEGGFKQDLEKLGFSNWSPALQKIFFRWLSIDNFDTMVQTFDLLEKEDTCKFDLVNFAKAQSSQNIFDAKLDYRASTMSFVNQWVKSGRFMLELELTQKVLQAQEKLGKEPQLAANMVSVNSTICPGATWNYQNSPATKIISINFSEMSRFPTREGARIPLKYNWHY